MIFTPHVSKGDGEVLISRVGYDVGNEASSFIDSGGEWLETVMSPR
jgi:hypothetical protein